MLKFLEIENIKASINNWLLNAGIESSDSKADAVRAFVDFLDSKWESIYVEKSVDSQFNFLLKLLGTFQPFSLASIGDGEASFLLNKVASSYREIYTEEARAGLIETIEAARSPNFYLTTMINSKAGFQNPDLLRGLENFIDRYGVNLKPELNNARIFYNLLERLYKKDQTAKEKILAFLRTLSYLDVYIVGPKHLSEISSYVHYAKHIETPSYGATCWIDKIYEDTSKIGDGVFLFSAGIASNVVISRLSKVKPKSTFIDLGSFWDILIGIGTRKIPSFNPPMIKPEEI